MYMRNAQATHMRLSQINKPYMPMQEQQCSVRDIAENILQNRRQVIGLGRRTPCDGLQEDLVTLGSNLQRPEQTRQLENSSKEGTQLWPVAWVALLAAR